MARIKYFDTQSRTWKYADTLVNSGGGSSGDLTGAVRYDITQNLTASQKQTARQNIGVSEGGGDNNTFVIGGWYDGSNFGAINKTYNQIITAHNEGKIVELHLRTDETGTEWVLPMIGCGVEGYITFGAPDGIKYEFGHHGNIEVKVNNSNVWSFQYVEYVLDNSITTAKIVNKAVTNDKLADRAVTEDKIDTGAVTMTKIANGAVNTGQIANGAVTNAKIYDGAVRTEKIADGAVSTNKLGSWSVTTEKIDNGAVTNAKIVDGAITSEKITDGAVTTSKIKDGAVVKDKLSNSVQDSLNKADNALPKTGGQMSGDIVMLGHSITGLPAPQVDSDAATKAYVDSHVAEEINIIHITGNDPDPYGSSNYWICDVKNSDVRNLLDSGILLAEIYDGSLAEVYDASMPQIQLFSTKPTYNIIWTLTDTPATMFDVSGYEVTRTISPIVGHTHNNKAVLDNITQAKVDEWNAKYSKPSGGIPKADLANDVQVSLGKADTALQTHQSLAAYRTSAQQDAIDGEKQNKSTLEADVEAKGFIKSHRYEITSLYVDNSLWINYFEFGGTFQYSDLQNIFNNGLSYSIRIEDPEAGAYTYLVLDYSDVYGTIYGHFFVGSTMRFFKAKEEGIREIQS